MIRSLFRAAGVGLALARNGLRSWAAEGRGRLAGLVVGRTLLRPTAWGFDGRVTVMTSYYHTDEITREAARYLAVQLNLAADHGDEDAALVPLTPAPTRPSAYHSATHPLPN